MKLVQAKFRDPIHSKHWKGSIVGTALIIAVGSGLLTGCTSSAPSPISSASISPSTPAISTDVLVGQPLDAVEKSLTKSGLSYTSFDSVEDRSIWSRKNWIVVSAEVSEGTIRLGARKLTDPECSIESETCAWTTVAEFNEGGKFQSEWFAMPQGIARLRYEVSAEGEPERLRVGDIYFQDKRMHTESSSIDTIIYVDKPGSGVEDLGNRGGEYFVSTSSHWSEAKNPRFHVVIETLLPVTK